MSSSAEHRSADVAVDMKVDRVADLFARFDPAPLECRGISPEADQYVTEQVSARARDMPSLGQVRLRIVLPSEEHHCFVGIQEAFQSHFAREAVQGRSALTRHFRAAWRLFVISIAVALVLVFLSQWVAGLSDSVLLGKIANGLSIVVWVLVWRPTEMLLHDWWPLRERLGVQQRLARVQVECLGSSRSSRERDGGERIERELTDGS